MSALIKTFDDDIYIIKDKTADEVRAMIAGMDEVRMPNGSWVNRKAIAGIQEYEDYQFQVEQKIRHKKGQFIKNGHWNDVGGQIENAELERITGSIEIKKLE